VAVGQLERHVLGELFEHPGDVEFTDRLDRPFDDDNGRGYPQERLASFDATTRSHDRPVSLPGRG
jgi:hypothetical protein